MCESGVQHEDDEDKGSSLLGRVVAFCLVYPAQKMLDLMVRDYSNNIGEAEAAVAQTIGNLRKAEDDHRRAVDEANNWGRKAIWGFPQGRRISGRRKQHGG